MIWGPKTGHLRQPHRNLQINPQDYLTDVLARIVLRADADPIDDLLPYNWADSRAAVGTLIDQAA
jgi:hypothetical protein